MTKCDACIVGGGVPGMVLAVLLGSAGLRVALIDNAPPAPPLAEVKPDGRTVALMGGSVDSLAQAGIWPLLKAYGAPLKRMAVVDDSLYPAAADAMIEQMFDSAEIGREAFGWNLPLNTLRAALCARIQTIKTITHFTNVSLENFEQKDAHIFAHISGCGIIHAALLIGCDGRNSAVRTGSGIAAKRRAYGQTAMTCLITHSRSHNDSSIEFHRPGGPFTIVPMAGLQSAIVWVEKDDDAKAFLKLPRPAFAQALADRTRKRLGQIELLTNPAAWPLEYVRAEKLTGPRTALAAEAAHVISPIGAQGLNLSLRDVTALAAILLEASNVGLDIGSETVLARYERAREPDVATRSFAIDLANQAVASDTKAVRALRRLTLRALSMPGPLRALIMKKGLAA